MLRALVQFWRHGSEDVAAMGTLIGSELYLLMASRTGQHGTRLVSAKVLSTVIWPEATLV